MSTSSTKTILLEVLRENGGFNNNFCQSVQDESLIIDNERSDITERQSHRENPTHSAEPALPGYNPHWVTG